MPSKNYFKIGGLSLALAVFCGSVGIFGNVSADSTTPTVNVFWASFYIAAFFLTVGVFLVSVGISKHAEK